MALLSSLAQMQPYSCVMQKSVLWAEDLEGHRQPSLYYLSGEDGSDGPHLICDWNGTPTDFCEMEFDSFTVLQEQESSADTKPNDKNGQKEPVPEDEFIDYPNPAAEILKLADTGGPTSQTHRQNDLDFAECAHLDFLSVPPMTGGLLKRFVRNLLVLKSKYPPPRAEKNP